MPRTITAALLRKHRAFADQVREFERRFPEGVTFADEDDAIALCVAVADVFDWNWAAKAFLSAPALAAYSEARATAWAAYGGATAPAWPAYMEAKAAAWAKAFMRDI